MLVKTKYIYENVAKDYENRFVTSNYGLERPPPNGKKDICWPNERQFRCKDFKIIDVGSRAKTYSYLTDDNNECKKSKSNKKKCAIKR